MASLSQTNFPNLWLLMQKMIGGNGSKQEFATKWYSLQKNILEIGCSVGNVSSCFTRYKDINFVGIDIDAAVIRVAEKRFKNFPNFNFRHCYLSDYLSEGKFFDYILFAGILHHVDDQTAIQLLQDVKKCAAKEASIIVYDPEMTTPDDNILLRLFLKNMEQGQFVRSRAEYQNLIELSGLRILDARSEMQSPGIVKRPYVARFSLFHCMAD
jgi:cyclopropane fatty-acyl-phospholipid synthase-like methyltransferase